LFSGVELDALLLQEVDRFSDGSFTELQARNNDRLELALNVRRETLPIHVLGDHRRGGSTELANRTVPRLLQLPHHVGARMIVARNGIIITLLIDLLLHLA